MINKLNGKPLHIGWHTYEPGLRGNGLTSAGGAIWIKKLWRTMEKYGMGVDDLSCLSKDRIMPKLDLLVLCWRWDFPNEGRYIERHKAYEFQTHLIDVYSKRGTPIMVHDQDYQISPNDLTWLKELGVHLYEPSIYPRSGFKSLHFPTPYVSRNPKSTSRFNKLVYIGNNYDRYNQFKRYFGSIKGHKPVVYGNWIEEGIDRESPEQVLAECPHIDFRGRLDQKFVTDELRKYMATVHLARPAYCANGFVTIRWAEAVDADIVGFVPWEFRHCDDIEQLYVRPEELEQRLDRLSKDTSYVYELLECQNTWVNSLMRPYNWIATFKELAK